MRKLQVRIAYALNPFPQYKASKHEDVPKDKLGKMEHTCSTISYILVRKKVIIKSFLQGTKQTKKGFSNFRDVAWGGGENNNLSFHDETFE